MGMVILYKSNKRVISKVNLEFRTYWRIIKMYCNKDCQKCKNLNVKVDDKGYPWGYECLRYGDSVFLEQFTSTKEFTDFENQTEIK